MTHIGWKAVAASMALANVVAWIYAPPLIMGVLQSHTDRRCQHWGFDGAVNRGSGYRTDWFCEVAGGSENTLSIQSVRLSRAPDYRLEALNWRRAALKTDPDSTRHPLP